MNYVIAILWAQKIPGSDASQIVKYLKQLNAGQEAYGILLPFMNLL